MKIEIRNDGRTVYIQHEHEERFQAASVVTALEKRGFVVQSRKYRGFASGARSIWLKCGLNPRGAKMAVWFHEMGRIDVTVSVHGVGNHRWEAEIGNYRARYDKGPRWSSTPMAALSRAYRQWAKGGRTIKGDKTEYLIIHLMRKHKILKVGNKKWEELAHG